MSYIYKGDIICTNVLQWRYEMLDKKEIRKKVLKMRSNLTENEIAYKSNIICRKILTSKEYDKAKDICLYMPMRNEVDVTLLIKDIIKDNKKVWLPKIDGEIMDFHYYDENTELIDGPFNTKEPSSEMKLAPNDNTLIIMPGAAFTLDGDRIGYGGGFYDKYLEKHPCCKTVAVCYDFQIVDEIPSEEHDIKPGKVISDMNMIIKKATLDDSKLLVEYMMKLGEYQKMKDSIVITEEKAHELLEKGAGEAIFGYIDEKPVAFIYYYENSSAFIGERGIYIDGFYVEEKLRGNGYGKEMMKYIANEALARGCKRVEWVCLDWNEPAINFYNSLGARKMDIFTTYRLAPDAIEALAK